VHHTCVGESRTKVLDYKKHGGRGTQGFNVTGTFPFPFLPRTDGNDLLINNIQAKITQQNNFQEM
jgi:hypothetical protein